MDHFKVCLIDKTFTQAFHTDVWKHCGKMCITSNLSVLAQLFNDSNQWTNLFKIRVFHINKVIHKAPKVFHSIAFLVYENGGKTRLQPALHCGQINFWCRFFQRVVIS